MASGGSRREKVVPSTYSPVAKSLSASRALTRRVHRSVVPGNSERPKVKSEFISTPSLRTMRQPMRQPDMGLRYGTQYPQQPRSVTAPATTVTPTAGLPYIKAPTYQPRISSPDEPGEVLVSHMSNQLPEADSDSEYFYSSRPSSGEDSDEHEDEDGIDTEELAESDGEYKLLENGEMKICAPKSRITFMDHDKKIKKVEVGERRPGIMEKVIMMVGATGSGKTTLINGMYNYIVGMEWKDDYRLKLIHETTGASQAKSQTNWITAYTIHHKSTFTVPYTLTIIDTPGFGDTSGIKRDEQITEQIRTCFQTKGPTGIDHLDAIGFVEMSSLARLTPTQRYVFESILSLFGKDIEENIFMLLTFADSQKPQVLSGIKEANIPYKKFFKFNNSALFVSNQANSDDEDATDDEDDDRSMIFDEMFWSMGQRSFKTFMTELGKTQEKSVLLTKDVLEERHKSEVTIEGIQLDVKRGLNKLEQLRTEQQVLDKHQADIDKNKNFTYTVNEEKVEVEPVDRGQYTTNCIKCNRTCHKHCKIPDDDRKAHCWAMGDGDGKENCRICEKHCHWSMHRNQPYVYVVRRHNVTKTVEDLKKKYEEASGKKLTAQQLVKKSEAEFDRLQLKVLGLIDNARKSIEKLEEIALRPNPLSTVNYIELLIKGEKTDCKPGWEERMDQLIQVKEKAIQMEALAQENYDPLAFMKKEYEEERKERRRQEQLNTQLQTLGFLHKKYNVDLN